MILMIFYFFIANPSFHQIGISSDGTIKAKVVSMGEKSMLYLDVDQSEAIDSLIIHTDYWRIVMGRTHFTDECVFEMNTAETTVLKKDLVKSFELRINGKSKHYQSIEEDYIRKKLLEKTSQ